MAENKKGFVLYADLIHTINKMPSEKAGDLFKHILSYVNDKNPKTDDILIDLVFEPIKQQLKRDLKKYEDKKVQWSDAGKRSAELRKAKKDATESTDVESRSTESTVIVKDNVIVKDIVKDINIIEIYPTFSDFWNLYDKKVGREISLKKWNKLKQADKEAIMLHIPGYRNSVSDIQYLKNPTTYLNGKCWNDEIIINKTQLKDERRQQISEFARAARDLQSKSNKTPIYKIGGGNG